MVIRAIDGVAACVTEYFVVKVRAVRRTYTMFDLRSKRRAGERDHQDKRFAGHWFLIGLC